MEHTRITPPAAAAPIPPEMVDTLAHHGLRELLFAPIPKVARALAGFDREQLGVAIEVMIAMLDAADGDPDNEAEDRGGETIAVMADPDVPPPEDDGDPDLEEVATEDSFLTHAGSGAGCSISDPGGAGEGEDDEVDDEPEFSHAEWHTLPAATRRSGAVDGKATDSWRIQPMNEDDEDDDPREEDDGDSACDDINCDDIGMDLEPEEPLIPSYGIDQTKGAEPHKPWIDRHLMKPHRDRIRSERCEKVTYGGTYGGTRFTEYRLREDPGIYRPR